MKINLAFYIGFFLIAGSTGSFGAEVDSIQRGQYLAKVAGCVTCHTEKGGEVLSGGRAFMTPFGTFYTPNITPDNKTGIGSWSDKQFVRAVRHGRRPDGKNYFPAFPYTSFTKMTTADVLAIRAYLKSVTPIAKINLPQKVKKPFTRFAVNFWKLLYFRSGALAPIDGQSALFNRGAYLADAVMHCAECHTPRDGLGGPLVDKYLAGMKKGIVGDKAVPNITRDQTTGLGSWSRDDYLTLLKTGETPDGDNMGGEMKEVIKETSALTAEDQLALVEYLMQVKAVKNKVD